jgi:hypothetical protein
MAAEDEKLHGFVLKFLNSRKGKKSRSSAEEILNYFIKKGDAWTRPRDLQREFVWPRKDRIQRVDRRDKPKKGQMADSSLFNLLSAMEKVHLIERRLVKVSSHRGRGRAPVECRLSRYFTPLQKGLTYKIWVMPRFELEALCRKQDDELEEMRREFYWALVLLKEGGMEDPRAAVREHHVTFFEDLRKLDLLADFMKDINNSGLGFEVLTRVGEEEKNRLTPAAR